MLKEGRSVDEISLQMKHKYPESRHHNFTAVNIGKKFKAYTQMKAQAAAEEEAKKERDLAEAAKERWTVERTVIESKLNVIQDVLRELSFLQLMVDPIFDSEYDKCWSAITEFEEFCDQLGQCTDLKQKSFEMKEQLCSLHPDHPLSDAWYNTVYMNDQDDDSPLFQLTATQESAMSSNRITVRKNRQSTVDESREPNGKMVTDSLYHRSRGFQSKLEKYAALIDSHLKIHNVERQIPTQQAVGLDSQSKESLDGEVHNAFLAFKEAVKKRQQSYSYVVQPSKTIAFTSFSVDGYGCPRGFTQNLNEDGKKLILKFSTLFDNGLKNSVNFNQSSYRSNRAPYVNITGDLWSSFVNSSPHI
jgi:hypothetical protein